jgi:V-type H+-transporting ATPase subunit a
MARRVRFFSNQIEIEKDVFPILPLYDSAPLITVGPRAAQTIDELDVTLAEHELRLVRMNDSYQTLSERTKELVEARHVLRETAVFFDKVRLTGVLPSLKFTDVLLIQGTRVSNRY